MKVRLEWLYKNKEATFGLCRPARGFQTVSAQLAEQDRQCLKKERKLSTADCPLLFLMPVFSEPFFPLVSGNFVPLPFLTARHSINDV
jgi:hypothetical protein